MSSTTSSAFPLATEEPCTSDCGNSAGTANSNGDIDGDAGAGGSGGGAWALSEGGMIAIIVVVVIVAIVGSKSSCYPRTLSGFGVPA